MRAEHEFGMVCLLPFDLVQVSRTGFVSETPGMVVACTWDLGVFISGEQTISPAAMCLYTTVDFALPCNIFYRASCSLDYPYAIAWPRCSSWEKWRSGWARSPVGFGREGPIAYLLVILLQCMLELLL